MKQAQLLGEFVAQADYYTMSPEARERLKMHVLDAIGCAIVSLGALPTRICRDQVEEFGGRERCTLIGGGRTNPPLAAFYNTALVSYSDFADDYVGRNGVCHPAENLGAVLAASEDMQLTGKQLLAALAVAFQVQYRLADALPGLKKGLDSGMPLAFSVAAGVAKALGLDAERSAHAIVTAGSNHIGLNNHAAPGSHWQGLAASEIAFGCTHVAYLAKRGITGPLNLFEGPQGLLELLSDKFKIDWSKEDLEAACRATFKFFAATAHAQAAIYCLQKMRERYSIDPKLVSRIKVEVSEADFKAAGGGDGSDRKQVLTKEDAQQSMNYLLAVALLDGEVSPKQFSADRIVQPDVQRLLKKVVTTASPMLSSRYPQEVAARVTVELVGGTNLRQMVDTYPGYLGASASWEDIVNKFDRLTAGLIEPRVHDRLLNVVHGLDEAASVLDLTSTLSHVARTRRWAAA